MLKLAFIYTKRPPQSLNYGGQINYFSGSITSTSFGSRVSALSASAALFTASSCDFFKASWEYSGSDGATDLQKAIDLAKQASELSKRGIFADESVKNKADELLKANAKRLSDYYRSLL